MSLSTEALTVLMAFAGLSVTSLGGVMIALINKGNKQLRPNGGGSMFDVIMQMNTRLTRVEDALTVLTPAAVRIEGKVDVAATTAAYTAGLVTTGTGHSSGDDNPSGSGDTPSVP